MAPGDFFALLGPNGAGKSTLIGIVSSLVNKSGGSVARCSGDIGRGAPARCSDAPNRAGAAGIQLQHVREAAGYLRELRGLLRYPARASVLARAEQVLKEAQLWDKADKVSRSLSGGMKRRLMIARAMMTQPKLLILDEPTAGVDIEIRRGMWKTLKDINAAGTTIILTTHYLEEAESLCRNLAIIDHGRIVEQGPMKSLLAKLDVEGFRVRYRR
ncbi:MAG: ABC transporter ATP-binding protein [Lysobacterales bacterium]